MNEAIGSLLELSHEIGRREHRLAILGEGNTSMKVNETSFAVKASGACLETMTENDVTVCDKALLTGLLDKKTPTDEMVEAVLMESRLKSTYRKPSVEAMFHAWLLTLDGINFVGHCHPLSVNQVLCSPRARDFAERRLFPDEVVCCGPSSVFVPYADPGLALAREIRERTSDYIKINGFAPRLIVLQNHGIIAIGATANSVLACLLMAEKAGEIFAGAASLGGPNFLPAKHVERIFIRPDEAYRQRQLKI
jgi:rhamnose utilization protein RhaD (predicted bifunctional aldolase and dehydrogenase)